MKYGSPKLESESKKTQTERDSCPCTKSRIQISQKSSQKKKKKTRKRMCSCSSAVRRSTPERRNVSSNPTCTTFFFLVGAVRNCMGFSDTFLRFGLQQIYGLDVTSYSHSSSTWAERSPLDGRSVGCSFFVSGGWWMGGCVRRLVRG